MQIVFHSPHGIKNSEAAAIRELEKLRDSWKGYASFLAVDSQGSMEIDLLIFTHSRIILVEIKKWSGHIDSDGSTWKQTIGSKSYTHTAPTHIKREHSKRLEALLKKELAHKWGMFYVVEYAIVLAGNATIGYLAPHEEKVVYSLKDFMNINEQREFELAFPERSSYENMLKANKRPNNDSQIKIFENWFYGAKNKILKRQMIVSGYELNFEKNIKFIHPKKLYKDIIGYHVENSNSSALVRYWDFSNLTLFSTSEQRANVALRESRLIRYLETVDWGFKKDYLLQVINPTSENQITEEVIELYNLSNNFIRLDDYKNSNYSEINDKYELIRAVLSPMARLHELDICHRDLSLAKLWWDTSSKAVIFSSFSVSKFPEATDGKSVSNVRPFLCSNNIILPEDVYNDSNILTLEDSYKVDVFQLGIIVHFILFQKYPNKDNEGIYIVDNDTDSLLKTLIDKSLAFDPRYRYKNAGEMLVDFDKLTEKEKNIEKDDAEDVVNALKIYNSNKIPFTEWLPINSPENSNDKISYETKINGRKFFVKIWTNLRIDADEKYKGLNRRLLEFTKRIDICRRNNLPIHQIKDFGFGQLGMHIVYSFEDGISLAEWYKVNSLENRIQICLFLINAVNIIHDVGLWHGDLKPDNIIIDNQSQIKFIDFLDINSSGHQKFNEQYIPKEFNNNFSVDNYAVHLIVREIIPEHANTLIQSYSNGLGINLDSAPDSLDNLKLTLNEILIPKKNIPEFKICFPVKNGSSTNESFESDGGLYYCSVNKKTGDDTVRIYLTGKNHKLTILGVLSNALNVTNVNLQKITPNEWLSDSQHALDSKNHRSCVIEATILICNNNVDANNDEFIKLICNLGIVSKHLKLNDDTLENTMINEVVINTENSFSLDILWRSMLETEKDFLPVVNILAKPQEINPNKFKIDIEESILDFQIAIDDEVSVFSTDKDSPKYYGKLNVEESGDGFVVIEVERKYDNNIISNLKKGAKLKLSEYKSAISWNRRNKALQRVLDKESTISDIIKYFDIHSFHSSFNPVEIVQPPLDLLNIYNLDDSKKSAFLKVLKDPINVIQGPPGTGKTTLLANLLDYILRTNEIKNVLLVSQSNAAVNEVAIKFREVSRRIKEFFPEFYNEEPSMVRLGDLSNTPELLHDIHVNYIQSQIRTKFFREFNHRLWALTSSLGLSRDYIFDCAKLFINLGSVFKELTDNKITRERIINDINKNGQNNRLETKLNDINEKLNHLRKIVTNYLTRLEIDAELIMDNNEPFYALIEFIGINYSINNPQIIKRLYNLLQISYEWYTRLIVDKDNFSGFLAKSRKLVIGTLVGIGKGSYNISDIEYDLVIIDEAARANASELSLAMQSGRRILLVGDHKQLPPLYNEKMIESVCKKLSLDKKEVIKTDFERVFDNIGGVMLNTQYRMAPAIGNLVSELFYDRQLMTGRESPPQWLKELAAPWDKSVTWIDTSNSNGIEQRHRDGKINELEVDITIEIIYKLIEQLFNTDKYELLESWYISDGKIPPFGIITGYREQRKLMETKLQSTNWYNSHKHLIRIDTIDAFQGQESRLLILNLVRSNHKRDIGFLKNKARVNVALSRAKERLIIIGDKSTWGDESHVETPIYDCLKVIENIIKDNNINYDEYQIIPFFKLKKEVYDER